MMCCLKADTRREDLMPDLRPYFDQMVKEREKKEKEKEKEAEQEEKEKEAGSSSSLTSGDKSNA